MWTGPIAVWFAGYSIYLSLRKSRVISRLLHLNLSFTRIITVTGAVVPLTSLKIYRLGVTASGIDHNGARNIGGAQVHWGWCPSWIFSRTFRESQAKHFNVSPSCRRLHAIQLPYESNVFDVLGHVCVSSAKGVSQPALAFTSIRVAIYNWRMDCAMAMYRAALRWDTQTKALNTLKDTRDDFSV